MSNAYNLAPAFLDTVLSRYDGTRLGRQEIDGEIVEERNDALWTRAALEACRVDEAPALARVVVAVDPPGSARPGADACGLVAAGCDGERHDLCAGRRDARPGLSPQGWAVKAIALWRRLQADCAGGRGQSRRRHGARGDRARPTRTVPVITVRATRGKYLRAEPVAQLYEQGRVKHAGAFRGAGRRDVRLRPRRAVVRALARPARCAGVGGDGAEFRGAGGAEGEGVVIVIPGRAEGANPESRTGRVICVWIPGPSLRDVPE